MFYKRNNQEINLQRRQNHLSIRVKGGLIMGLLNRRKGGDTPTRPPSTLTMFPGNKGKTPPNQEQMLSQEELHKKLLDQYKAKIPKEKIKNMSFNTIANALIDNDGFLMKTALALNTSYSSLIKMIRGNPKLQDLVKDTTEAYLDLAENRLRDLVVAGDKVAIIFSLKCKGKHRGWLEDSSPSIADETPPQFVYEVVLPPGFKLVQEGEKKQEEETSKVEVN